ncbi:MAG: esterase family protein [Chloroflexi bacterium]|nr:esterase family protein [Chloroflexota bacterium]
MMNARQGRTTFHRFFSGFVLVLVLVFAVVVINAYRAHPSNLLPLSILSTAQTNSATQALSQPSPTPAQTPVGASACSTLSGSLHAEDMPSAILGETLHYQVYLPPCFDPFADRRYPVLYLLHGLYTDESQWNDIGLSKAADELIAEIDTAFIVVMPRLINTDISRKFPIHQVIPEELIPHIDSTYPTLADRDHRAIGGISRGATLALRIGFNHRTLFRKIGMHSFPMLIDESNRFAKAIGEIGKDERPELFLDVGDSDPEQYLARNFEHELAKLDIPHSWHLFSGSHDGAYWAENIAAYLKWYAQGW